MKFNAIDATEAIGALLFFLQWATFKVKKVNVSAGVECLGKEGSMSLLLPFLAFVVEGVP